MSRFRRYRLFAVLGLTVLISTGCNVSGPPEEGLGPEGSQPSSGSGFSSTPSDPDPHAGVDIGPFPDPPYTDPDPPLVYPPQTVPLLTP